MDRPPEDLPAALCTAEQLVAELFTRPLFRGVLVRLNGDTRTAPKTGSASFLVSRAALTRDGAAAVLRQSADALDKDPQKGD